MELVTQKKLHFKDSKSDKVYEVELYHIQSNEYVVNFRYGRRGKNLKEGTKTVFPVDKAKAEKVFEDLVASKTKKGYREVQSYDDTVEQTPNTQTPQYELSGAGPVVLSYLKRRAKDEVLTTNWRLSRIIWRAGELELSDAIPAIAALLPTLRGQEIYAAVWTLGRLASPEALQVLKTIPLNSQDLHYRIQVGALLKAGDRSVRDSIVSSLPESLKAKYISKSYEALQTELIQNLSIPKQNAEYLLSLYYLSIHDIPLRQVLKNCLFDIDVIPGKWKYLRYIYKVAEMIKDGETFGQIARLVNLKSKFFNKNRWSNNVWLDGKSINVQESLAGEEPLLAFSKNTKKYFINRTLRRLRKAGTDQMESYCELAAGILIAYHEEDANDQFEMNVYHYDWESRSSTTTKQTYPPMSGVPYFYYILFAQGDRIEIPSKLNKFYSLSGLPEWTSREDSFSELWDRYPQYAVKVLAYSKQRDAMNFGLKVLEGRSDLELLLSVDSLIVMLSSPFSEVIEFSLIYIEKKYNANKPNEDLIIKLVESENEKAIHLAVKLLDKNPTPFIKKVVFIQIALLSRVESIHDWLRKNCKEALLNEAEVRQIIEYCLSDFKTDKKTAIEHEARIETDEVDVDVDVDVEPNNFPQETLVQIFPNYLKRLDAENILELINHPLLSVQLFGAKLININDKKPDEWPDEVMIKLMTSEHAVIRAEGKKLFSSFTDEQLLQKTAFIIHIASSEHQDLRITAREIIGRLAPNNNEFGQSVLQGLYQVLMDTSKNEELLGDVYLTIEQNLLPFTPILLPELDAMLDSNIREIHLLTHYLLENENIDEWPVEKVAKLGSHDMHTIRDIAHNYFEKNVEKVKYKKYEAINILDTDWPETRSFGRAYFDKYFTAREWEPELIIALCDNVRPETQEYGTRVLGKYFNEEHGAKYLTALSEHPDPIIELYSTNYLNQYAFNNDNVLHRLKPYFVRTLSAINTRRIAKQRVFHFLKKQAMESEAAAMYVSEILNDLVGTIMIQENENYVSLLYELKQKHPKLDINIEKVQLEIR